MPASLSVEASVVLGSDTGVGAFEVFEIALEREREREREREIVVTKINNNAIFSETLIHPNIHPYIWLPTLYSSMPCVYPEDHDFDESDARLVLILEKEERKKGEVTEMESNAKTDE